ncbi:MAG: hypothetical protein HDR89_07295 [Bacteroides sp.]|nr:hypothetical protein [Bacteroides sp.]
MKTSKQTVTLTIEEIDEIIIQSVSGNIDAVRDLVKTKIQEKNERLEKQRERRRQRLEQKKAAAKSSATSESSELSESSEFSETSELSESPAPEKITLPLDKALASCILWINNRRDALKTNITRFVSEIARAAGCPSALAAIESALNLLLRLAENSAPTAFNHLHAKHRLRPTTLTLSLSL